MKEAIQLKDFLQYRFLSDLKDNPQEEQVLFTLSQPQEETNTYASSLYVSDAENVRQLTSQGNASLAIWEDAQTVLFASCRDEEDKEAIKRGEERTVFYRISTHGGEALKAFTIPLQVTDIKQVEKGLYALLVNFDLHYSHMYEATQEEKQRLLAEKKDMQDYEVLDELPFYGNGQGYTNKKRTALFLYKEADGQLLRISEPYFNTEEVVVDERTQTLYYSGAAYTQKAARKSGIWAYHIETKKTKELLAPKTYAIGTILLWQDRLCVLASDQNTYGLNQNYEFYVLNPQTKELELFAHYEDAIGSSVGSDCRYGGGDSVKAYGDKIYFITTLYNKSVLCMLDKDGNITPVYDQEGSVDCFTIVKDRIYFIGMQDLRLQEVYTCLLDGRDVRRITHLNDAVMKDKDVRPCVPLSFKQEDMTLYGWVLEPRNYDPAKSYPAILDIHGGPKTVYGEVYYHEMQVWANLGYFVFFMNPRGGDGRGNRFADLRGKYGTIDYEDLMQFTDEVLRAYPSIDAKRVGVTGGSYGGFMTNWIITHTDRFAAAASQRSIANWISFEHTSDIGEMFAQDQQGGNTWDNMEKLWWHSPLKYAPACTTPTLFIHSDEDFRCPYSEGLQMYSALCEHGVETRLCMFKGENHELSRSGKPRHRVKRLEEITNWMNKHLQ